MESDSQTTRHRGKHLGSKKLTALEKLKKARQGEKISDEEEEEEELYDYIEEEYEEEDKFESKKKNNKNSHHNTKDIYEQKKQQTPQGNTRKNLTKDKTSNIDESATDTKTDIRTAFFKASTNSKSKPEKLTAPGVGATNYDDDLANEIMLELQKKKNITNKPKPTAPKQIPFSINISQSPAHKRKLSPSASIAAENKIQANESNRCHKKIELDDDLVQQLFDSDSQPSINNNIVEIKSSGKSGHLNDVSNSNFNLNNVKTEPIDSVDLDCVGSTKPFVLSNVTIKKENNDILNYEEQEALENIELLSQLTLEATNSSLLAKQLNLPIKQELNTTSDLNTTADLDMDFQLHIKNHSNSNKLVFYWIDAYEDQFNANGTIYLFGKMPILKQKKESATETQATNDANCISFVSVCCIVKNIPKVIYVLPRKYKKNNVKREPGSSELENNELVTMEKVAKEIDLLMEKHKIHSYKTKIVKKNFAFDRRGRNIDIDVPYESEYLQVEYSTSNQDGHSTNRQIPLDSQGEFFSCIFGSQTSYLEQFLIDLKVKGPCWLHVVNSKRRDIEGGTGSMLSWSKLEYVVDNYRTISLYHENVMLDNPQITLPPTPPLTILTLLTRTMLNTKTQEHEIVSVCGLVSNKFYLEKATMPTTIKNTNPQVTTPPLYESYFCALTKPSNAVFPYDLQNLIKNYQQKFKIELCGSERALLAYLLCKIHALDVDILVGHDLFGFNFDILLNRCVVKKVPHWSRLGRLKRTVMPSMPSNNQKTTNNYSSSTNNLITQQRVQTVCSGRLLCDIMLSSKELLTKCKSFDLTDLVNHVLKINISLTRNLEEEKNVAAYYSSSQLLLKFLQLTMMDATYIMRICNDLQCLQLAYQITCIAGNVLSRTLVGGRSERNEYLLLHAFYDKDFILPEKYTGYHANKINKVKQQGNTNKNKKSTATQIKTENITIDENMDDDEKLLSMDLSVSNKSSLDSSTMNTTTKETSQSVTSHNGYTGGLVLEPRVGFYDRFILLLDFNSLYPSIIQEYNICFTTIGRPNNELSEINMDEYLETCIKMPSPDEKTGILPLEIKKLVDSRRQVKQLMADKSLSADLRMQYDIRQKALKLTANSVYGCLGFENSRFYCKPLAALITKNGRSILMKTKELVENKKIEVIYGDTDSIMINTNLNDYDQVIKLGNMIKSEVNKLYKHLEIDIDGVYKCLLLLRKKKYAALTVTGRNPTNQTLQFQQEIKGLDVVRRDWCILAKQTGEKVISEILSGQPCDLVLSNINKILSETSEKIKNNSYDLSVFEISKQLNRNPEDYSDSIHQPHVLVALRHNADVNNSKKYKSGNVIAYVVCEDGTTNTSTQRAYSKSELLKTPDKLKLDTNYYLTQQIHPVVTRLCEPIEGIDAYHIAQSLGLDPTGFKHKTQSSNATLSIAPPQLSKQQKKLESYMNEIEKYSNCIPFKYLCPDCKTETLWQCPFVKLNSSATNASDSKSAIVKQEPIRNLTSLDIKMEEDEDDDIDDNISSKKNITIENPNFKCILDACSNATCKTKPTSKINYIKNSLTIQLFNYIKQYYQGWLVCEDPMCSFRTKRISCKFVNGKPQCIECERYATCLEYTDSDLYYQMKFFKFIFDIEAYKNYYKDDANEITNLLRNNRDLSNGLNQLKEHVNKKLKCNVYGIVNLSDLFKRV